MEKTLTTSIGRRLKEAYAAGAVHEDLPPAIAEGLAKLRDAEEAREEAEDAAEPDAAPQTANGI